MKMSLRAAAAGCVVGLLLVSPAAADYRAAYRAYTAAMEAGDYAAAEREAENAWRLAETELGDNPNTAVLAVNYAQLVAESAPAKAAEAYERALALAEKGVSDLDPDDLKLRARLARFYAAPAGKGEAEAEALAAALAAYRAAGGPPSHESAHASLRLATDAAAKGGDRNLEKAASLADAAAADARALDRADTRLLREALTIAGVARTARRERKAEDIAEAVLLLDEAISLYPPQRAIDAFDPELGYVLAWRAAVGAVANSLGGAPRVSTGTRIPEGENLKLALEQAARRSPYSDSGVKWAQPHPETCEINWEKREPAEYPRIKLRSGDIGSAVIGYDLEGTRVVRAVILGEVGDFGEASRKAALAWTLAEPVAPECARNLITNFAFVIVS